MSGDMREMTAREALTEVLAGELRRSPTVFLGETVRGLGAAGVAKGLFDEFGPAKVIETPVSENAIFGAALGLALGGLRPVVEIYSADFLLAVANEVINDIAKWRHQQGAPAELPITIRGCMGANGGLGPEHSQCMEAFLHHAPGLTIVVPGTPADAAGLLRSSLRSPDPVVFLEHRRLYDVKGTVPQSEDFEIPLGVAEVVQSGSDLTLVAWGWMRQEAQRAVEELLDEGVSVELIDPRTIRPFDWATVQRSVQKTGRLLVAEESPMTGSVSAEIIARVSTGAVRPPRSARVTMPDAIHPYSAAMEAEILPVAPDIVAAARCLLGLAER
ncbi:alpha-ketoacid dehydrogenase subunit beta [Micromonospora sp. NPDC005299]|uniref:alpha-ketoacid dehydrogenase subunit beta n=1 Tax=Micromonospora sp. NPDC005299 TaxID=3364231 RepID=UPI0036B4B785